MAAHLNHLAHRWSKESDLAGEFKLQTQQGVNSMTIIRNRAAFYLAATVLAGGLWFVGELAIDASAAYAAETPSGQVLVDKLKALRPSIPIEGVSESPLPGIYALEIEGGTVFYGTADGRYLFTGDLYELGDTDLINLAELNRSVKRIDLLAAVPEEDMVIFSPAGTTKAVVSIFTDVDCGFCRKLHKEVPELNALGVEVRYLAYPRAGIGSESYHRIVSAWCADDRNAAITLLKSGDSIPTKSCDNPVSQHYELGRQVGVTGTPAIVTEDGRLLPGFMPAEQLAKTVGI